jgi:hypothetical protein
MVPGPAGPAGATGATGLQGPAGPLTGTTSGAFRGFATVSINPASISGNAVGCTTATFTGAVTTDRVMATPQTVSGSIAFASAQISAANTVQVCVTNVNGLSASDPAAFNVFVAVYIP